MAGTPAQVDRLRLPLQTGDINPDKSIKYIQQLLNITLERQDVLHMLQHIKLIIDKELRLDQQETNDKSFLHFNQVRVNVAFRIYYQLLQKYELEDNYFSPYIHTEENFTVLYFILLTAQEQHFPEPNVIKDKCLNAFAKAVDSNDSSLLDILKTLNLIFKKWPHLDVGNSLSLDHVYFCLQDNQGMRDEMLTLLQHVCLCREKALEYFIRIVNFWPWTYRNKLYMLVCILSKHSLTELLEDSGYSGKEFFEGLRSTLNYKNLLASSQHVIKALSSQRSEALLRLCADILSYGSLKETRNLYAQWFSRIQQKDDLFHMLWNSLSMKDIIDDPTFFRQNQDPAQTYRIILVYNMFSKEILHLSAGAFSKLSEELLKNCFNYDLETQLIIFKFIVDNLGNLSLEQCMAYFTEFSRKHMTVENSQFRNTILGKMPSIINHVAKMFCKVKDLETCTTLESNILIFFQNIQSDIESGIASSIYQPKIFCLKLLEILMRSLYGETVMKNSKNCSLTHNQKLAEFLQQNNVFDGHKISRQLLNLLNDPTGFDDALSLIVILLRMTSRKDEAIIEEAYEMCIKACSLSDVDESNLSYLYARVAVQNSREEFPIRKLFKEISSEIKGRLELFQTDPLYACKSKGLHLFACLNVLNEVLEYKPEMFFDSYLVLLETIEEIAGLILRKLNICNTQDAAELSAASFEDIDKSLQLLVDNSKWVCENHELARKYLLMSFWLTLKACCDLSVSMGVHIVSSHLMEQDLRLTFLQRCLQVNTTVLTKCRHKGAIEAAGVTIGKLTKSITTHHTEESQEYQLLHSCLQQLYDVSGRREVSTTRRGAGFSIMFLHIVKNEENRNRPILRKAIRKLLMVPKMENGISANSPQNCDRVEALHLHYLCVLVRDTELREAMSNYYNEIMMAAITHIDNSEWTVRNAALQLLGALVPKIVGQRQATEFEESLLWEPSEISFCEVTRKLGMSYDYIINYCLGEASATGSIILFLEFLHKVEYIHKDEITAPQSVQEFRQLMWSLLSHPCEKVRKLSSKCFVRSHEFSHELPQAMAKIAKIVFAVKNENFFDGLVQTIHQGVLKLQHDLKYVIPEAEQRLLLQAIRDNLAKNICLKRRNNFYTLCKLWDLFELLKFNDDPNGSSIVKELRKRTLLDNDCSIGYDLWLQRIK